MRKKWLSYLLTAAMLAGTMSPALPVSAADAFSDGGQSVEALWENAEFDASSEETEEASDGEIFGEDGTFGDGEVPEGDLGETAVYAEDEISEGADTEEITSADEGEDAVFDAAEGEGPKAVNDVYEYTFYTPAQSGGGSSFKYYKYKDLFEAQEGLTYQIKTKEGEEVVPFSDQIRVTIDKDTTELVYMITATDADGNVSKPVEVTIKTVGIALELDSDLAKLNGSNYYYVYDENNTQLQVGISYTLAGQPVEELPEELQVTWTSNKPDVVSVDDTGLITFSKPAAATWQCTLSAYTMETGSVYKDRIQSSLYFVVFPEKLKFTEGYTVTMPEDGHVPVPYAFAANTDYTTSLLELHSINPEIAEVKIENGKIAITPKKAGIAYVFANCVFDRTNNTTFSVQVDGVSVAAADGSDTNTITIDPLSEESPTLALEATGTYRKETFTWSSTDESIATVDENGVVTGHKEGSVTIYATSSRSTEETPIRGGLIIQVKENQKPYLKDLSFYSYKMFEGWNSANDCFRPAKLDNEITIKTANNTLATLRLTPYFDSEAYDAVLLSQTYGGEYEETVLENGVEVNKSNAIEPGHNLVYIKVSDKADAERVTTYTYDIYRPYTTTKTITRLTFLPNGQTALTYPTYKNQKEGTLFRMGADGSETTTTGFTSNVYNYKAYVFGERTSTVTLTPTFGNAYEHVYLRKDNGEAQIATTNWASAPQELNEEGTTVFTYEVMSSQAYADAQAKAEEAGEEFVFTPETVYTITVEKVSPLGIDAKILDAELSDAQFYSPGFSPDAYTHSMLLDHDQTETKMTFQVPEGIEVYNGTVKEDNLLEGKAEEGNEEGVLTYEVTLKPRTATINLKSYNEGKTESGIAAYSFTINSRGPKDVVPDSITEYLCLGSQYTNLGSYGLTPERTLVNGGSTLSIGNFGGYITYKYDKPIVNDPNNPYGVDFIVYGNPFAAQESAAEPGNVMVSQDGVNWYYLAGSAHYDDEADWNYSMTYSRTESGQSSWTDSNGVSGVNYNYPNAELYPLYNWDDAKKQSITVSGVRLNSDAKDPYGSSSALYPDFGYVDVNVIGSNKGTAGNPYVGHTSTGDAFDLDWAVDANGMPVHLDSISYIRVTTASSIYAGAIGEKSTEVTAVYRTLNTAEGPVGKTQAPSSIFINGTEISPDEEIIDVDYTGDTLDVKVTAAEDANVYINGARGTERSYESVPVHGILRIITQEGEKEPDIRYLRLRKTVSADSITLSASKGTVEEGKTLTLSAELTPSDATDAVEWISSDESIATVQNGVVTGIKAGTVTITAKAGSAKAACVIVVKKTAAVQTPTPKPTQAPAAAKPVLAMKVSSAKASAKLTWNSIKGADGYKIYGAKCGQSYKLVKTVKGSTLSFKKTGLKKTTYYKYYVVAYKKVNGKNVTIAKSPTTHFVTTGGKYGNAKKITVNKSSVSIKKNKTSQLKVKVTNTKKQVKNHVSAVRYLSSNTSVATVSKNGLIKGKAKGTCYVYCYANNGLYKRVKVTVK